MITNGQIHDLTYEAGISPSVVSCDDRFYECMPYAFIQDELSDALEKWRKRDGTARYRPEAFDCDNFAKDTVHFATRTLLASKPNITAGVACGLFGYRQASGGLHMINVFVVDEARLLYYEPQADTIIQLGKGEIESCIKFSI